MKRCLSLALGTVAIVSTAYQVGAQNALKVCPDPAKPCQSPHKTFDAYELSFQLPAKLKPNVDYKSVPFYAVVCKIFPLSQEDDCTAGDFSARVETERRRLQRFVPGRKAFAENLCPNMAAVSYETTGKSRVEEFVAVYAGTTRRDAEQLRARLKKQYPAAQIAQMRVVFQRIEQ